MRKVFPQGEWATDDKGLHVRKVYRLERCSHRENGLQVIKVYM